MEIESGSSATHVALMIVGGRPADENNGECKMQTAAGMESDTQAGVADRINSITVATTAHVCFLGGWTHHQCNKATQHMQVGLQMARARIMCPPASRAFPWEGCLPDCQYQFPGKRGQALACCFQSHPLDATGPSPHPLDPGTRMPVASRGGLAEMSTTSRRPTSAACLIVQARTTSRFLSPWLAPLRFSFRDPPHVEQ